ncbi:MAG TPA: DUF502 domain-containing protein, partial [Gammaproteobacteria bacterium]|nr:DUF502 domain-containing protein [Gammaproteobacteria bacterium]
RRMNQPRSDAAKNRPMMARLRRYIFTGLIVWMPLTITIIVFQFIFGYADNLLLLLPDAWQPKALFGFNIPGLGVAVVLIILFLTGFLASNYLGRVLLSLGSELMEHIPVVRSVYSAVKQISDTLFTNQGRSFSKVVMIRYPQKDTWSLAFQTSESLGEVNMKMPGHMVSVFVPTTPNPTSGFLLMVSREDMIELDMSVDDALKMIISLGVIVPPWPKPSKDGADSELAPGRSEP